MPSRNLKCLHLLIMCVASFICFSWINDNILQFSFNKFPKIFASKEGFEIRLIQKNSDSNTYYRKSQKMKYVLVWSNNQFEPFSSMSHGRTEFNKLRCPSHNCYVTLNRTLFKDIRDFDVIAFNGKDLTEDDLPQKRAKYQKYIFFNMDSSANHPVDEDIFDGFFNATATYRLDSDIPLPHLLIKDTEGNEIGPQKEMYWVPEEEVDHKLVSTSILKRKDRAAAVYLSTCRTLSGREQLVANLQKELKLFGLAVDVYGPCGPFKCSKNVEKCRQKMTKTYYFYLAFENSLDRDYVTGKLLVALQNYVVPIVFGGANYSRFLPPGSYLDAMRHSPANLAKTIEDLLSYPNKYLQYFWWKKFYTYHNPKIRENICNICATVTDKRFMKRNKIVRNFTKWWNVDYTALQKDMKTSTVYGLY